MSRDFPLRRDRVILGLERLEAVEAANCLLALGAFSDLALAGAPAYSAAAPANDRPARAPDAAADTAFAPSEWEVALADNLFARTATQTESSTEFSRFVAGAETVSSQEAWAGQHMAGDTNFDPLTSIADPWADAASAGQRNPKSGPSAPVGPGDNASNPSLAGANGATSGNPFTGGAPAPSAGGSPGGGAAAQPNGSAQLNALALQGAFSVPATGAAPTSALRFASAAPATSSGAAGQPGSAAPAASTLSSPQTTTAQHHSKPASHAPKLLAPTRTPGGHRPAGASAPLDPSGAIRDLPGFTTYTLPANDDNSAGPVNLGFTVNFGATQYSSLFVNDNGNVTFASPSGVFTPSALNTATQPIIAPFFADVDTSVNSSLVTYGTDRVNGHAAFGVDWFGVNYYNTQAMSPAPPHVNKLDTFQLVLIDRSDVQPGAFDVEYNYGGISWETGDASGGINGLGGTSAYVGYSDGNGVSGDWYQLAGSGVPGSFLDTNTSTGLINNSLNSGGVNGRYDFSIRESSIVIANPGVQSNADGDAISLPIQASGGSGSLSFGSSGLPPGLSINQQTGLISGTIAPTADAGSPYATIVTVSDGTHQAIRSFSWYVGQPPAPSLELPGNQINAAGDAVLLQLTGTGSSGTPLTYSATGLPGGLSVNQSTGLISGTITSAAASTTPYQVTATVSNGTSSVSQSFFWTVNFVGLVNPGYQFNNDGDTVSLAIQANSASGSLTYGATGLPPNLNINQQTGLISGTITSTADANSPYSTTVTVSDGAMHQASQSFLWYVGQPPVLSLDPPGAQVNAAGDAISLQLTATDWNTPLLTYSATGLPDGLNVNPSTGLISGTITDAAASTTPYQVTATVFDGTNRVSQTFSWTVNFIGLTNPGDQFNNDGEAVSLQVTGHGASGRQLIFSATGLPPELNIDQRTGLISGTIFSTADAGSPYSTTVTASDGINPVNQSFLWYVSPQPTLTLDSPGARVNAAGEVVALQLSALDASTATLMYSATGLPDGLTIDQSAGIISGTVADDAASTTPYQVTATVFDGTNSVSKTFPWAVNFVGLGAIDDQNNLDGDTVSLQVAAHDAYGRLLTFSATGLPAGLNIDPQTGFISGTIAATADTSSPYTGIVTVFDGIFSASQAFLWDVSPQPPLSFTAPTDQINAAGDIVNLQLSARDAAGNQVTYSATPLPDGLSITTAGLISGTVATTAVRNIPYLITVTASDGTNSVSQTFGWRVTAQGSPQTDVPGDTLATAEPVQFPLSRTVHVAEAIGDNNYGSKDVDLYAVQMAAGDSLILTNQASAATVNNDPNFGIAVRIFNSSGTELANAGEGVGLQDADTVSFTALASGTYYIGISFSGNTAYNPQVAGSGTAGLTGAYDLTFSYVPASLPFSNVPPAVPPRPAPPFTKTLAAGTVTFQATKLEPSAFLKTTIKTDRGNLPFALTLRGALPKEKALTIPVKSVNGDGSFVVTVHYPGSSFGAWRLLR